ncbi:MAG TPA: hypothetical protein VM802_18735 [Chitinophaga sp.]|uniref:DUF4157 domain-containing protein n=1 Tax=Chitinophaga sp. TaxID=1869181 RepID=UPI002C613B03|nr:DUF4157 domain-containing protein [Chitinophaga sp.]HVI46923.1 hypothetical protein [Chitinophaga sp.]
MEKIRCHIKEYSWLARVAALKLGVQQVAIVVGRTIYLYGASRAQFLSDEAWVRHEVCHVKQYQQYGKVVFLWRYLAEYFRKGYYLNSFEVAARASENDPRILDGVEII